MLLRASPGAPPLCDGRALRHREAAGWRSRAARPATLRRSAFCVSIPICFAKAKAARIRPRATRRRRKLRIFLRHMRRSTTERS